ncbi:MAG: glycosyltransferase, partial [Rhodospirillales bacterium]|nr:glycosyltransferase [Rhodospirillales bacterium]
FPINGAPYDVMSLLGDMPERAEILYDREFTGLETFLAERGDLYDLIWVARTHNLRRVQAALAGSRAKIILDTEALASCREAARGSTDFDLPKALAKEFFGLPEVAHILAVSEAEAGALQQLGMKHVCVLGTAREATPTKPGFAAREGLLFIGAIHQTGAPNEDSLRFYKHEIYPALAQLMQNPPLLNVAGHVAAVVALPALGAGIKCLGEVADTAPLYEAARIFIAPTRFAAGTPYKIYEAAAMGLPCVVTTLLAEQLGWVHGEELLAVPADEPMAFAAAIARLYHDEALWMRLREGPLKRLRRDNRPADFAQAVKNLLAV